ncbi:CHAT domain-containing protein [Microbacterium sp. AZCO]|uniref:CHAT domain-containing protein n=1 Tax=Microbacterium sp. AZCO TaxID=3142976 RepID=UPI0031F41781
MASEDERAFEAVTLANSFVDPRGRAAIVQWFPQSVVDLYDAVVARPDWQSATTLAERAFVVISALRDDPELEARYRADVEAGELGFGAGEDAEVDAAIAEVASSLGAVAAMAPDDGLLGGGGIGESWSPDSTAAVPADDGLLGGGGIGESWSPEPGAAEPPPPPPPPAPAPSPSPSPAPSAQPPASAPPAEAAPPDGGAAPPTGADEPSGGGAGSEAPAETVQTWLNAEVQGGEQKLEATHSYVLAVFFGEKSEEAAGAAPAAIPFGLGQATVDLSVQLVSSDFTVPPFPQQLRVGRDGASIGQALFPITPLHDGHSTLSVLVDVQGNFLQRLELEFDIGTTAAVDATAFGRPAGAAVELQPRTASMQFMPATGGYQLFVKGVTDEQVFVQLTDDELGARIEGVRKALLETVKDTTFALEMDIPPDLAAKALKALAFAGFRLYQAIFSGPFASDELKKVGAWLRESLADDVTTLQVVSRGFPVPWALMYLTDRFADDELDWKNFIGMRHVVEQVPMREISALPPAATITSTPDLSVRVLYHDGIDATMPSHPVAAQRAYWENRGVTLGEGTKVDDLVHSALSPTATDKVLYLYCHAVSSNTDSDSSYLVLTGDQQISLGQLAVYAPIEDQLQSHPLVVVNACESGDLSPDFYDGFVPYFLAKGARGVIGTECKTPGRFASEWGIAFFDRLFSGEPLGEAVLGLRRDFLEKHGNPLGLLYGVHCDTDTRVDPALAAAAAGH